MKIVLPRDSLAAAAARADAGTATSHAEHGPDELLLVCMPLRLMEQAA